MMFSRRLNNISTMVLVASSFISMTTVCEAKRPGNKDELKNELFKNIKSSMTFEKLEGILPAGMVDGAADIVSKAAESGVPGQLGYGFMMGYSSGYCVKKVSKMVAFVVGGFFMGVQALAYHGYANIDQGKIMEDFEDVIDLNKDGRIDAEDGKLAFQRLNKALTFNMPAGGGFTAGLLYGLKN